MRIASISQHLYIVTVRTSFVDLYEVRKRCIIRRLCDNDTASQETVLNKASLLIVIPPHHVEEIVTKPLRTSIVGVQDCRNTRISIRSASRAGLFPQQRKRSP